MLNKNKYWKTLLGINAEAFVAKAVAYTTDATYTLFQANAVEGEVGLFNADTNALYDGLAAAPAGAKVYFAIKRDGLVERSATFTIGTATIDRTAYVAPVAQVSDASFGGTIVAGKAYGIRIIETTPGYQQFPSWYYEVTSLTGETLVQMVTRLIALINDTTNITNKGTDTIVTAAIQDTDNIRLTANAVGVTFRIGFSADAIADLAAAAVYTPGSGRAAALWGNGSGPQVVELEKIGDVMKGVTTNYPKDGTVPADYGVPTAFADAAETYTIYWISEAKREKSPTPTNETVHNHNIVLAIPAAGGPDTEINAII